MSERTCGECTACCTNLGVSEIQKPDFEDCRHQSAAGCAIYSERPLACMAYECLWLEGILPDPEDRPDRLHAVFTAAYSDFFGEFVQLTHVFPGIQKGTATGDRVARYVETIGERVPVLLMEKERRTLIAGPEAIREKLHTALLERSKRQLPVIQRPHSAHERSHSEYSDGSEPGG
jgi:hypothetical protein